jgi:hypothetical protein
VHLAGLYTYRNVCLMTFVNTSNYEASFSGLV